MVLDRDSRKLEQLREEHECALRLGLAAQWLAAIDGWPLDPAGVHSMPAQAQFNPWRFTLGLARALRERGVDVYTHSRVLEVDPGGSAVVTAEGRVRAGHIVLATHTPLGINLLQTKMEVYREYGVAGPLGDRELPAASVWVQDQPVSLRSHDLAGDRHLVIVGGKHKAGEAGEGDWASFRWRKACRCSPAPGPVAAWRWRPCTWRRRSTSGLAWPPSRCPDASGCIAPSSP